MTLSARRSEEIFHEALDVPAGERTRFLADRCGSDTDLLRDVQLLLRADAEVDEVFLERRSLVDALGPGTRVGRYTLGRRIGEGGMGTVYSARQDSPERDVALKVIRADRLSPASLQRFRREVEVLGRLQHSGIAQVFDAGRIELRSAGESLELPYLVMELVEGVPLLEHVRSRQLDRRARVELVARICDAVAHAHGRGVVHRDLKPENVLVAAGSDADVGHPKVLDFGIARLIEDEGGATFSTHAGQLVGSLACMSPEQVSGDSSRIDTRSDVYSLGVLLYRLLVDKNPINTDDCSIPEAVRRIADGNPPRLSFHDPSLRGDLTVIASKALSAEPDRRYRSAAELADDLRRHLRGLPITARTDSAIYVAAKAIRRHRSLSVAAVTVLLSLVTITIMSIRQSARLGRELTASTIERARLVGATGNFELAEEMMWREFVTDPGSRHAYRALWELYERDPCLGSWSTDVSNRRAIDFHPDGLLFATGREGSGVFLWDARGRGVRSVLETTSPVDSLAFSPDGGALAVGHRDGGLSFWSVEDRRRLRAVDAHEGPTLALDFAEDGRLASAGADALVRIWSPDASAPRELEGSTEALKAVRFSPDGSLVAAGGSDGHVRVWRESDASPAWSRPAHPVIRALAFTVDGKRLASGGDGGRIHLWDPVTGEHVDELDPANGAVRFLESPSESPTTFFFSGWWKTLAWDTESDEVRLLFNVGFDHGAFHPTTGKLAAASPSNLRLWDLQPDGRVRFETSSGKTVAGVATDRDWFAVVDRAGSVRVHDLRDGRTLAAHPAPEDMTQFPVFAPEDGRLFVGRLDELAVVRALTGEVLSVLDDYRRAAVSSIAFSPDGRRVAYTSGSGRVRIRHGETLQFERELEVTTGQSLGVAFHPDGGELATTYRHGSPSSSGIQVWSTEGELLWECPTSPLSLEDNQTLEVTPWSPAYSDDGTRLAAGGWGNVILVWDAATGGIEQVLRDHQAAVWDVEFRPGDRDTIVSISDDGTVKLWDVPNARCLVTLTDPADAGAALHSVGFAPDGDTLVVGGEGGATVWDLTYFDRHVAGNLPHQLARFEAELGGEIDRKALESWADEVFSRPWPRITTSGNDTAETTDR